MIFGKTYGAEICGLLFEAAPLILGAVCLWRRFSLLDGGSRMVQDGLQLPLTAPGNYACVGLVIMDKGVETVLRKGTNGMVCTADQVGDQIFYVNCFHETVHALLRRASELSRELSVKMFFLHCDDLHTLLTRTHRDRKYVLVGHSSGGVYVRIFAARFPEEVVGMVLLDAQCHR